MKKLLLTTLACIFSNLCFANDFNWKVMKNPPTDIKCHWSNAGNAAWIPKDIKTDCFEEYNMTIFLTPQILLKNGKTTIQIIFGNTKAKTEKLGFTYRSNKEMFEIPIVKNNTIKMKGKLFYLAIAEITPSEYIKRFILSYPEFVFFRIPTLIKSPKVRMNGTQCYVWETSFTAMKPLFNIKSEQFEYVLQLPITDNAVCMELWNNQPGTVIKWIIVTQSGKRWTLECGEQIPKVVDGTTVYIAQYFFQKAWYLDNLVFDPIVSMEFSVTNKGGTQDYTFALTDKDKTFISQKNASLTSSSPQKNVQTTTMQSPKSQRSEQQIEAEVKKIINDWLSAEQLDSYKSFTYWENPKFKPEFFGVNDWKIIGNQYEWSEKESNFVVVMVNLSSRGGIPLKKRMTVQVYKRYGQWKIKHCRMD